MLRIEIDSKAKKFLVKIPSKHAKQIGSKLYQLQADPKPHDSMLLKGYDYWRADSGEYRIIYKFTDEVLYIVLIGKRNDDEVYKILKRH